MNKSAHIFVSGMVQGVGFRWWIKRNAQKMGINGWVRNLSDGRVEAVFQGSEEKVKKIIRLVKKGNLFSKVEKVEILWEDFPQMEVFEIKAGI